MNELEEKINNTLKVLENILNESKDDDIKQEVLKEINNLRKKYDKDNKNLVLKK